jgi:hypothetical protein
LRSIRDTALLTLAVSAAAVPTAVACNRPPRDPKPTTPCVTTPATDYPTTTSRGFSGRHHRWHHGPVCVTPTPAATPTPTPAATPTPTPTATPTPTPVPTPTPEPPTTDDGPIST